MENYKPLILIVDDTPVNIKILGKIVHSQNYRIAVAQSGKEALKIVAQTYPDLILLDIMMPEMDGYEVCRRLKSDEKTNDIPIIFISAKADSEDIIQGFETGAVDYITKPFYSSEVIARINTHIQLKLSKDYIAKYNSELETMLEQRTKELVRSERQAAFAQLIQGIVHNLKNPIAKIYGCMELINIDKRNILDACPDVEKSKDWVNAQQHIDWIQQAATEMNTMIQSMMAKSIRDKTKDIELFDLNQLIKQEYDFLDADLSFKHKIIKKMELCTEPIMIKAVKSEISQIFNNIVRNAIDALHETEDCLIHIETSMKDGYGSFSIKDNGPGIPDDIQKRIFDPFFTTKPTEREENSQKPIGTGLGLHYCLKTIQSYQGDIELESNIKGTTFKIFIPLAEHISIF
jgi:signal transduction histidine kinase